MKPTIEQLNALSDYEINCAVAKKLGYRVEYEIQQNIGFTESFREQYPHTIWGWKDNKSPCEQLCFTRTPDEYMPIAIEHGITIEFEDKKVMTCDEHGFNHSEFMETSQTGRAVCIVFLLMTRGKSK